VNSDQSGNRVEAVILAAGRSTRMGANKLIAPLWGKPVIAHIVDQIASAGLPPPLVVLGHEPELVRDALRGRACRFVDAPGYRQGLSQSLRSGIEAVSPAAGAAIICLADMPLIRAELLRSLAARASETAILVPRFAGHSGNPVLWGRAWFPRLTKLSGDVGAKALISELGDRVGYIDCEDDGICVDVDTPAALGALLANETLNPAAAEFPAGRGPDGHGPADPG
jgi:molybdenum cofactor cytidylyltransferase